jgi:hypothetical protein
MKHNNKAVKLPVLLTVLLMAVLLLSACTQAPGPVTPAPAEPVTETPAPGIPVPQEKVFLPAASDPWRDYSFEPASLKTWINEEDDEILDVWIRIDYKNNPGAAVRDEQQWHIDYKNNRYKVSDSFAYDADGNFCET